MSNSKEDELSRYAGASRRLIAFGLDFLVIGAYILVLAGVGIGFNAVTGGTSLLNSPFALNILAFVVLVLPVILYFSLQESSSNQGTWGKRRAGLKVVDRSGGRLSWRRALVRSALKFVPWQLAHICVIYLWFGNNSLIFLIGAIAAQAIVIAYILCLWLNRKHQTPYDWLSGVIVISTE